MGLDRLWAGWRSSYMASAVDPSSAPNDCVFCGILESGLADADTYLLWRGETCFGILNAYPYTSGHLMVMPIRHVGALGDLTDEEGDELFRAARAAVAAIEAAYRPEGANLGANLGHAAGAGVPGHLHLHALPRWAGDTNFMTSIAEARVLPEPLGESWRKLRAAWPR